MNCPNYDSTQAELREWSDKACSAFDMLLERKMLKELCSKKEARLAGIKWIAKQLVLNLEDCHIETFNVEMCKKVVELCNPYIYGVKNGK